MLYAIDSWLINKLERFSHWTQRTFGLKSDDWARVCLVASAFFALIEMRRVLIAAAPWLVVITVNMLQSKRKTVAGVANTLKMPPMHSLRFLALACGVLFNVCTGSFYFFGYAFSNWFRACDDLPPGESKINGPPL